MNKWLKKSIYGIAFVAIVTVLLFNIIYINNIDNREISSIERYSLVDLSISILIAIAFIGISYFIQKLKISKNLKKAILIIGLLIYAIGQIGWIHQSKALPFADSEQILVIAKGMIGKGELNPYCFYYLQYYPQQLTLSTVIAGIFKILNTTNYMVLQYGNILANIFTVLGLYRITKKLSEKYQINKVLFFIMTLTFVPMILLATFVYGDFIGLAFVIWATYFAMKYTKQNRNKICDNNSNITSNSVFSQNELFYFCNCHSNLLVPSFFRNETKAIKRNRNIDRSFASIGRNYFSTKSMDKK